MLFYIVSDTSRFLSLNVTSFLLEAIDSISSDDLEYEKSYVWR